MYRLVYMLTDQNNVHMLIVTAPMWCLIAWIRNLNFWTTVGVLCSCRYEWEDAMAADHAVIWLLQDVWLPSTAQYTILWASDAWWCGTQIACWYQPNLIYIYPKWNEVTPKLMISTKINEVNPKSLILTNIHSHQLKFTEIN